MKHARTIATLLVLLVLVALPFGLGHYGYYILATVMIYAIVALSLNVLIGMGGQISIGHAGFWALGAYGSALVVIKLGFPFLAGVLVGGLVAAIFGALVALPALRVQGHYLAIATLGFALFVQQVLFEWEGLTGGRQGLFVPRPSLFGYELQTDFSYYYVLLAVFLLLAWITGNFAGSHTGRSLMALKMSSVAAECCGIARPIHIIIAFTISAFFTGVSGALYGHLLGHLSTETFSLAVSLSFLTMAVIGGLHSRAGALLGGAYLALAPELLREFKDAQMVIYGITLILCVQFLPGGLISLVERVWTIRRPPRAAP
ncbi:MAG: branched-chain amino acid ABC transporter permease [Bradyrhizobiaceae bacterium]|nr:MAG: branched-chain amino acid ABC transporter permease [Bradyrhizobiaceae bacterium]